MENLLFLGVPILKHIRVHCDGTVICAVIVLLLLVLLI